MSILITNIGTSDLAIQITINNPNPEFSINGQKYYLPIDTLWEPNQDKTALSSEEEEIYDHPQTYFKSSGLYKELKFPDDAKPTSRELTEKLLQAYKNNPDVWHSRIRLPRILGVIKKAIDMNVNQGYIFVSNQTSEKLPHGHEKDTLFLYDILKLYIDKAEINFDLICEYIPANIPLNNSDLLFDYYSGFFNHIHAQKEEEIMLISIKGGTNQMKTALQLQAMSVSAINRLLFVNPQLSIKNVLLGLSSECQIESYWRYMRTHKYQTVRLLLERWDFDGAIQVFKDWQDYLDYLKTQGIIDQNNVEQSREFSNLVSSALKFSRSCSNLDFQTATRITQQGIELAVNYSDNIQKDFSTFKNFTDVYYKDFKYRLLNLYTLNRIYRQLEQNALFLTLLSSFCEEVLHGLILKWDGNANYWREKPESAKFELNVPALKENKLELWDNFVTLQRKNEYTQNFGDRDIRFYKLGNRYNKRNFAESIVKYRNQEQEIQAWNQLSLILQQLDFWIDKRNDLIHSAKGLSWELMQELYNYYSPESGDVQPCKPDEILPLMANILKNNLINLGNENVNTFVGKEANHYIYSFVRNWVVNQLIEDGLQKSKPEN
ncbi:MAG: hypothetical protein ACFCUV_09475 [Rivularia sp. (in: cyanobacteria)]